MSPFDFITSITYSKVDLLKKEPPASRDYAAFVVNRGLSLFMDTVLFANEMNQRSSIPAEWQYGFLLNSIEKRKRYSKWIKKLPASRTIELVKDVYGYSDQKAAAAVSLLSADQVKHLEQVMNRGGRQRK